MTKLEKKDFLENEYILVDSEIIRFHDPFSGVEGARVVNFHIAHEIIFNNIHEKVKWPEQLEDVLKDRFNSFLNPDRGNYSFGMYSGTNYDAGIFDFIAGSRFTMRTKHYAVVDIYLNAILAGDFTEEQRLKYANVQKLSHKVRPFHIYDNRSYE